MPWYALHARLLVVINALASGGLRRVCNCECLCGATYLWWVIYHLTLAYTLKVQRKDMWLSSGRRLLPVVRRMECGVPKHRMWIWIELEWRVPGPQGPRAAFMLIWMNSRDLQPFLGLERRKLAANNNLLNILCISYIFLLRQPIFAG